MPAILSIAAWPPPTLKTTASKRRCVATRWFVAQHATATCCRGCLEKWHGIPQGVTLDERQKDYIVQAIALWLVRRGGARDVSGTNIFDPDRGL